MPSTTPTASCRARVPEPAPVVSAFVASPEPFKAPIGTRDILPPESGRWTRLLAEFAQVMHLAGYGFIQTPMFEDIAVFRPVGEGTDVVSKEMYDFFDKGERHLALRPEGTASVVRAFNQHHPNVPWKVWYAGPNFRYEKPQAGRFRQHHQLGAECIGVSDPDIDVELMVLLWDFFCTIGLSGLRLSINSIGDLETRHGYYEHLRAYLDARRDSLDPEDRRKIDQHPMRVLDSKRPDTREAIADAPTLLDVMSGVSRAHFERVRNGLAAAGVPFEIEPRLVRGLDYYTHTVFEIQSPALESAQSAIGGGGRYDGLAEALGGKAAPGTGFAAGIERILLACDAEGVFAEKGVHLDAFVVDLGDGSAARDVSAGLRRAGLSVDRAFDARSPKAQMKAANRSGARFALIIGEDELAAGMVTLKDLRSDVQQELVPRENLADELRKRLS
ncbi:MAG: Histidine--tRNA ligase [Acidimicrobiales bacterium]|nr:MAG: histidine--tRNA ligase [Actinomycetota bacterium]MBV6507053.1 Histidine--tRNA ligase [Acidimicrobiales bacterium]RIK05638.1 MAG: histidine--tRNA ligase [Acidobacteriota bacterium]